MFRARVDSAHVGWCVVLILCIYSGLKVICKHIFNEVHQKSPGSEYKALGAFVFLRFICPR